MPLLIPVTELEPGMELHEAVVSRGQTMLQRGKHLTRADIDVLRRRFPNLSVRIFDAVLDGALDFEDDGRERRIAQEVQVQVGRTLSELQDRFSDRQSLEQVDMSGLRSTVRELLDYLRTNPVSAALVSSCTDSTTFFGAHAGNVFYLSMLIAFRTLDYVVRERRRQTQARAISSRTVQDLMPLGLGAMVMDVGLLPHHHLLEAREPLTRAESDALRNHPIVGADALPKRFSAVARTIVRTHHENMAGTGYPQGLPASKLHIFARIVRIADAFDAATSDHIYRGSKSPVRVLWEMTSGPYQRFYDPMLLEAFGRIIQPFPIGAKIRMVTGRYGAVVKYNRRDPFRPLVVVAFDENNDPLPRERLRPPAELGSRTDLRAAQVRNEDISFIYMGDPTEKPPTLEHFQHPLQAAYP